MKWMLFAATWCVCFLAPQPACAVSDSGQELADATRAKPNLDRGAATFRTCAVCHGPSGAGSLDGGVPRIAGQHFSVLVKQLVDFRHDRRWDIRMEHFADKHNLADAQAIADIAAYIQQLEIESAPGVGDGQLVARGANVYAQQCRSCHGSAGEGSASKRIPQLAGQHYEYLTRQIYDAVDGRRPNFSAAHVRLLARLQRDDIVGLADFLSRTPVRSDPMPAREALAAVK